MGLAERWIKPIVLRVNDAEKYPQKIFEVIKRNKTELIKAIGLEEERQELIRERYEDRAKGSAKEYFDSIFSEEYLQSLFFEKWHEEEKRWIKFRVVPEKTDLLLIFDKDVGLYANIFPFALKHNSVKGSEVTGIGNYSVI